MVLTLQVGTMKSAPPKFCWKPTFHNHHIPTKCGVVAGKQWQRWGAECFKPCDKGSYWVWGGKPLTQTSLTQTHTDMHSTHSNRTMQAHAGRRVKKATQTTVQPVTKACSAGTSKRITGRREPQISRQFRNAIMKTNTRQAPCATRSVQLGGR